MADLEGIGKDIVKEIKKQIIKMDLIDFGHFLDSVKYKIENNKILIYSEVDYAEYLEYGTYDFGRITRENFPATPEAAKSMKKKDMDPEAAKKLPLGMCSFDSIRSISSFFSLKRLKYLSITTFLPILPIE